MKKVIISVTNDLTTDQRVNKVATTLCDSGFNVILVGRDLNGNYHDDNRPYSCYRLRLFFKKGFLFYLEFNIKLFFFLLKKPSHILLANDLDTLLSNFFASILKKNKLIYDSHEVFTEVPELLNRPFAKGCWLFLESIILRFVKHTYTVSSSMSKYYSIKYGINMDVIKNVPVLKQVNHKIIKGKTKKIIYQGAVNKDRGIDLMIHSMKYVDAKLYIIGSGDLIREMIQYVKSIGLESKVVFLGQIHFDKLFNFTCSADLGLSFEDDTCLAYRYALPNKIFDYINAEIPVLVSDLPEYRHVINKYNVGCVLKSRKPKFVAQQINKMLLKSKKDWSSQLTLAKNNYCWQNEKSKLLSFFTE